MRKWATIIAILLLRYTLIIAIYISSNGHNYNVLGTQDMKVPACETLSQLSLNFEKVDTYTDVL